MSRYLTREGEMVDAIAAAELGDEEHAVDIYEANPGLARLGPILPLGTELVLPPRPTPRGAKRIRLWGDA